MRAGSGTPTATIAGFSGVWRRSLKLFSSCSAVYCGASTSASWPSTRVRVDLGSCRSTVTAHSATFSTSTVPLRSRMRPRGDSVCTVRVAARHGLELQLLLPAHLHEPQARDESPEQGDDDDADDGDPDAAVVAHRVKKEDKERWRKRLQPR